MALPTDKHVVICDPFIGGGLRIAGSRLIEAGCGHTVVIAPSGYNMISLDPALYEVMCAECFLNDPLNMMEIANKISEGESPLALAPGATEEIRGLNDVGFSDQLLAVIRGLDIKEDDGEVSRSANPNRRS